MKYALVTGGSRGIGRAVCIELAQMGYPVIINYNNNDVAAKETKEIIEKNGGTAELMQFDIANAEQVDVTLENWIDSHPDDYIAVLVNNAGIRNDVTMLWMNNEQWSEVIDTNLNGFFYVTRRLLKDMLTKRWGRIINVVSLSGIKGLPGQTNYSASKAGVIGATKALAQETAKRNITVNAVAPGFIKSDMTKDFDEKAFKDIIPVGRFGDAEEVAHAVAFLASEKASYITGEVISINGGLHT
ncbi:3-oxoacyl-ACP reductase FabG [Odoribacter sp. OttesenSCG-928-L07]|nr:3-oxoacyl-ACP reductase FabG [Odoribacter sp. OttesenSCG-928-L07]MDL2238904.1 3-oxoacyl-ACP reductase FabG [Bacteroidales bacterium OttesenSCG-928-L14]MDL2240644.1 3-oxoacyl-ACP reductase FabG [Bacteroidales bacterium OttesenSCG-928-K22]